MLIEKEFSGDYNVSQIPSIIVKQIKVLLTDMLSSYEMPHDDTTLDDCNEEQSFMDLILTPGKKAKSNPKMPSELNKFINFTTDMTGDKFWRNYNSGFPNLFPLFKQLKSIQVTSASIERIFSKAKLIYNDLAGNLDVDMIYYNLLMKN